MFFFWFGFYLTENTFIYSLESFFSEVKKEKSVNRFPKTTVYSYWILSEQNNRF